MELHTSSVKPIQYLMGLTYTTPIRVSDARNPRKNSRPPCHPYLQPTATLFRPQHRNDTISPTSTNREISTSHILYLYIPLSSTPIIHRPHLNSRSSKTKRYPIPTKHKNAISIGNSFISTRSFYAQNMPFDATGPPLYSGRRSARSGAMSGCHCARKVIAARC